VVVVEAEYVAHTPSMKCKKEYIPLIHKQIPFWQLKNLHFLFSHKKFHAQHFLIGKFKDQLIVVVLKKNAS
jgi:hypothetical protein